MHRLLGPLCRKIEEVVRVASEFASEEIRIARDTLQSDAEQHLGLPVAIERRGVDVVHAKIERGPGRLHRLVERDGAEKAAD